MPGIDVSKVLVGAPDQKTTGAVLDAPVGTKLPETASEKLAEGFASSGYVGDGGVSLTMDRSTKDIKDWSGSTVRKLLESFDGTLSWSEIQMSHEALCHAFGEGNVHRTPATKEHGEQMKVDVNSSLPPARAWVFNMKDGNARVRIAVPNGQVTSVDSITFASSDAIGLPLTLSCYPDETGNSIYVLLDDGTKVGA